MLVLYKSSARTQKSAPFVFRSHHHLTQTQFKMFKVLALFALVAVAFAAVEDESYKPYAFSFDSTDEFGTKMARQEQADQSGVIQGQYSYVDAAGVQRIVEYIAHPTEGFQAKVRSNEPGLVAHEAAAASYSVQ